MPLPSNERPSPEKRLLVCCARTRIDPAIHGEIQRLITQNLNWDLFLQYAGEHSVTPLVCRQLLTLAGGILEAQRVDYLKAQSGAYAVRNLALSGELITLIDRLRSAGVQAIPYKGPVLAVQAYGDIALREFEDLDIVLRQKDILTANDVLLSLGYCPKFPGLLSPGAASLAPAEYGYFDKKRRIMVEFHTERTLRHFPRTPDIDDLAVRLVAVSVGGQNLLTFSPEDTLILLCIHGSKHFWERLSWIADIHEFIEANSLDWKQVIDRSEAMRANRMLAISLVLAARIFGSALPSEVSRRVQADAVASMFAASIAERVLAGSPKEPGGVARFHLRRQMVPRIFEGWRYALRLATLPSDEDWSALRLPPFLTPFYAMLRPFRMLTKYGLSESSSRGSIADGKASN